MRALLTATALAAALPAWGQSMVTPDAFLDAAEGRTMTFVDARNGRVVGIEEFLSRDRSIWTRADGSCAYGIVTVEGPELCFRYDDDMPGEDPHCWWPFEMDGKLHVRFAELRGEVQRIERIDDTPVDCRPAPNV